MESNLSHGMKRVVSGVLALLIVAGSTGLPANVGAGGLFGKSAITASADSATIEKTSELSCTGVNSDDGYTFSNQIFSIHFDSTTMNAGGYIRNQTNRTATVESAVTIKKIELTIMDQSATYGSTRHNQSLSSLRVDDSIEPNVSNNVVTFSGINSKKFTISQISGSYLSANVLGAKVYYDVIDLYKADVTAVTATYTGSKLTPEISIGDTALAAGTDYTVNGFYYATEDGKIGTPVDGDVVNAGTYFVDIEAVDGSAYTGSKTVKWTVEPVTLTFDNTAVGWYENGSFTSSKTYTGDEYTPNVYYTKQTTAFIDDEIVIDTSYIPLTEGTDYDFVVKDGFVYVISGTNANSYLSAITPKGNYTCVGGGLNNFKWSITQAKPTSSNFTFKAPESTTYDGNPKTATIKVADGVTGMGDFTVVYGTGDSEWTKNAPTEVGIYYVGVEVNTGDNYYTGRVIDTNNWTFTIDYATTSLTLSDLGDDVKVVEVGENDALEKYNDTDYMLQGSKSYYIYTNKTVAGADENDSIATFVGKNRTYQSGNESKTYAYLYTIKIPAAPAENGYELSHKHATSAHSNTAGDGVYVECKDEITGESNPVTVAEFKTADTYYYGSYPTADDIETKDALGAKVEVTDFYFSATNSTTSLSKDDLEFGKEYKINARVAVTLDGKTTPDYFSITRTVKFERRPMTENKYYLVTGEGESKSETPLTVDKNGVIIVPTNTFTYNGTEQKPTIVVKNGGDETITVLESVAATDTADAVVNDFTNGITAQTNAGNYTDTLTAEAGTTENPANYSGKVIVKWSIAQADVSKYITVTPKNNVDTDDVEGNDAIVYDGKALDSTDFEYAVAESTPDEMKALAEQFVKELNATKDEKGNEIAAKTSVEVKGAEYTADITYEHLTDSNGQDIAANTVGNFSNYIINGNLTFKASNSENDIQIVISNNNYTSGYNGMYT